MGLPVAVTATKTPWVKGVSNRGLEAGLCLHDRGSGLLKSGTRVQQGQYSLWYTQGKIWGYKNCVTDDLAQNAAS